MNCSSTVIVKEEMIVKQAAIDVYSKMKCRNEYQMQKWYHKEAQQVYQDAGIQRYVW